MNTCETIERAAIFYNGVIYSVPRPGRHHTVIAMMVADGFPNEAMALPNQGFVTYRKTAGTFEVQVLAQKP